MVRGWDAAGGVSAGRGSGSGFRGIGKAGGQLAGGGRLARAAAGDNGASARAARRRSRGQKRWAEHSKNWGRLAARVKGGGRLGL